MGIKKKIILGFILIGSLLFLSGIISSLELVRFNKTTYDIMQQSQASIDLSRKMLDAVQQQNTALLLGLTDTTNFYDSVLKVSRKDFLDYFAKAELVMKDLPELKSVKEADSYYNSIVEARGDSVTIEWFSEIYNKPYYNLTHSIKEFMVATQKRIIDYTTDLEHNAYRTSMVGIIALAGGFLLILIFYFMINKFFISPVLKIRMALRKTVTLRLPYNVVIDTKDEIKGLSDDIAQMVAYNQKLRKEEENK